MRENNENLLVGAWWVIINSPHLYTLLQLGNLYLIDIKDQFFLHKKPDY